MLVLETGGYDVFNFTFIFPFINQVIFIFFDFFQNKFCGKLWLIFYYLFIAMFFLILTFTVSMCLSLDWSFYTFFPALLRLWYTGGRNFMMSNKPEHVGICHETWIYRNMSKLWMKFVILRSIFRTELA